MVRPGVGVRSAERFIVITFFKYSPEQKQMVDYNLRCNPSLHWPTPQV